MQTHRHIRSFVLRAGRMTPAQERALAELWPAYGLDVDVASVARARERAGADADAGTGGAAGAVAGAGAPDFTAIFGREAPRCLEIGFGVGEVIGCLAESHPHIDYVGIEVHRPGVGRLLLRAEQARLHNLRVICQDAVEVLERAIQDESFDEILIFFPDPWHKKRHHKRRLIDPAFAAALSAKLRPEGVLRLATDWQAYAEQMLDVCNANPHLESLSTDGTYVPRPDFRPPTRFERRGARLGHGVWDLAYKKR